MSYVVCDGWAEYAKDDGVCSLLIKRINEIMGTIQPRYKTQIGRRPLKKKLHTHTIGNTENKNRLMGPEDNKI